MERFDVGGEGGSGSEGEGAGSADAGSQVRASIRLSPEAAVVWGRLDRAGKVRLGALFNELVVWYGRTGRLPVAPISVVLSASEIIAKGFEVCRERLAGAEAEAERLRGEAERLKSRAVDEQACRQQLESLSRQLEEAKAREAQLQQQLGRLRRSLELERARTQRLAQMLCPHVDELKRLAGSPREAVELEALCWPKER